jgi:hypothetical protein
MKKILFRSSLILFVALYLPLHSLAWGMLGHRIVGQIADSYLTDKARAEIKKILGHETLAMASNYADFIRADSNYKYIDTWHYVNFPKGLSFQEYNEYLKVDTIADAYTKINYLSNQLRKKGLSKDKKVFYLKILIHLAEDIAQPLHASAEGTRGGNDIKLQWFNTSTNLHSVWDSYMIDDQKLSYTEYANAINFTTPAQRKAWRKGGLKEWLYDSYIISQQLQGEITTQNPRLSYEYTYNHLRLLNNQLVKGGVRLAALLNGIFH